MKDFIKKFTNENIINEKDIHKIGNKYFLSKAKPSIKPFSSGLFLGEKKKSFKPSFPLLELIQPYTKNKVIVNDKAAWLFICGRDILEQGILRGKKQGLVLILNQQEECLGFGEFRKNIVKNILDLGDFLRRER